MKWTKEIPTQQGFYWLRQNIGVVGGEYQGICEIVRIEEDFDKSLAVLITGDEREEPPTGIDGWWYGPLGQPELTKEMEDEIKLQLQEKKPESPIKSLKCEICGEIIAIFDVRELAIPLTGSMFRSKDSDHGAPDPFHPSLGWEFMRCPYCNKRPFIVAEQPPPHGPGRVLTPEGYVEIDIIEERVGPTPYTPDKEHFGLPGAEAGGGEPMEAIGLHLDEFALSGEIGWGVPSIEDRKHKEAQEGLDKAHADFVDAKAEQVFGKEDANTEHDPITSETQPTATQPEVDWWDDAERAKAQEYADKEYKHTQEFLDELGRQKGETHTCPVCGREFTKRMALVGHMKVHGGKR